MEDIVTFLRRLFAASPGVTEGCRTLINYCRSMTPNAPWEVLDQVEFEADSLEFRAWLSRNSDIGSAAGAVRAFYFGVAEDGASVHLSGASEFDPSDESCDWACSIVFHAEQDWTESQALVTFATISEKADSDIPYLLYGLCLGYVGLLIQQHAPDVFSANLLSTRPAAVGFDSGDAYVVLSPTQ